MKTTLLSFIVALFCCATLSAQTFGFRLGYNSTGVSIDFDGVTAGGINYDTKGQGNLMLGAFANLPIGTNVFSIQPEINYLNRGFEFEDQTILDQAKFTVANLEIGTLARLNFNLDGPVGLYVGVGPSFNYALSGKFSDSDGDVDIEFDDEDGVNRSSLYGTGVAGVNFGGSDGLGFFGEFRYQTSFNDFFDADDAGFTKSKQRLYGINVGIRVPLGG